MEKFPAAVFNKDEHPGETKIEKPPGHEERIAQHEARLERVTTFNRKKYLKTLEDMSKKHRAQMHKILNQEDF